MTGRITINDVADLAGVSKVTVSYVLNGRGPEMGLRSETIKRVQEAARELGYRPNALARMLSRQRTETIAVLFQSGSSFSRTSGFNGEVLDGVSQACFEEDFDLMLHTRQSQDCEEEVGSLLDGRIDGILVLRDGDDPTLGRLVQEGFPLVQFFSHTEGSEIPSVDSDNLSAGEMATNHLLSLGHRRIVALSGRDGSVSSRDRIRGFRRAMEAADMEVHPGWVLSDCTVDACLSALYQLLDSREPPTAVVAWRDQLAVTVMNRLKDGGLRVPEDLSIVGFDSLQVAENASPPLTSVHQPVKRMAVAATRTLIALIRGEELREQHQVFSPRFDVRGSTAPLRTVTNHNLAVAQVEERRARDDALSLPSAPGGDLAG